jgi:hypothetical protein
VKNNSTVEGIEYVATKVGVVLLVLGGMHFFNMFNIAKMRKKAKKPNPLNEIKAATN